MRDYAANRAALDEHGAAIEFCVCGGQILAINDALGILDAVTAHQALAVHLKWRQRVAQVQRIVRIHEERAERKRVHARAGRRSSVDGNSAHGNVEKPPRAWRRMPVGGGRTAPIMEVSSQPNTGAVTMTLQRVHAAASTFSGRTR